MNTIARKEPEIQDGPEIRFRSLTPEADRRQILLLAKRLLGRHSSQLSRMVNCDYANGTLILHGQVKSYYHKQLAQSLLKQLLASEVVQQIENRIEVAISHP